MPEGTPLTLIEGMANSRPVIATAVGGVVDLIGKAVSVGDGQTGYLICERGILVKSGDTEGFAQGLAHLVNNEALRRKLGACGRDFVLQNHSKERLFSDMTKLYQELIGDESFNVAARPASNNISI